MTNQEQNKPDTLFIDGFYSEDVPETAPEWILGKGSIGIDKMIAFLNANRHIAVNGAIKYTIKLAKTGRRYVEVDHFGMAKYRDYLAKNKPTQQQNPEPQYTLEDIESVQPPFDILN